MKSKVIIVDDHPIFRMGMAELLNQEEDFVVCGLAGDIAGARKVIQEHSTRSGHCRYYSCRR